MDIATLACTALFFICIHPTDSKGRYVPDPEYENLQPTTGELWMKWAYSVEGCKVQCYQDDACVAFYFGKNEERYPDCIGFAFETEPDTPGLVESEGWVYFRDVMELEDDNSESAGDPGCSCESWKQFRNSCYRFINERKSWDEARDRCTELGGYLAEITSLKEDMFIHKLLMEKGRHWAWIGANDKEEENDFRWVRNNKKVVYFNWKDGEPNNEGIGIWFFPKENCVVVSWRKRSNTTKWNDTECYTRLPFLCQRSCSPDQD